MKIGNVKISVYLDDELAAELERLVSLTGEEPATILRMAVRAGLPIVVNRHQAPRPEGYFARTYRRWPNERLELEAAFTKLKPVSDR